MSDDPRTLRVLGPLRIEIDRDLCGGFGDCVTESPEAFDLDEEGIAVFRKPEEVSREVLLQACDACPVDALTVWENGARIVP